MKVKTNLTPEELEHIGSKLVGLAKSQRGASLPLENPAEQELVRRAARTMDVMLESLQAEVARVLLDRD